MNQNEWETWIKTQWSSHVTTVIVDVPEDIIVGRSVMFQGEGPSLFWASHPPGRFEDICGVIAIEGEIGSDTCTVRFYEGTAAGKVLKKPELVGCAFIPVDFEAWFAVPKTKTKFVRFWDRPNRPKGSG